MVQFRNVDVDPLADPEDWPFEAILTVVDRGMLSDWARLAAAIRRRPWGACARAVREIAAWDEHYGADALFVAVVDSARDELDRSTQRHYGQWLRTTRESVGMTLREFAPRIGTSPSRLSSYENGSVAPSVALTGRVARAVESTTSPNDGR